MNMKAASNIEKLETHEHAMSFQNGKARDLMEYHQQQLEKLRFVPDSIDSRRLDPWTVG